MYRDEVISPSQRQKTDVTNGRCIYTEPWWRYGLPALTGGWFEVCVRLLFVVTTRAENVFI